MPKATSKQLRFPTVDGLSVRGDFDGSSMSSDFGPVLLSGIDRQSGLTQRLAASCQPVCVFMNRVQVNICFKCPILHQAPSANSDIGRTV